MKIARVEALHCDGGWRPWTFVRVETDDGLVGWGECSDNRSPHGIAGSVRDLTPLLIGQDPRPVERLYWDMLRATRQNLGGVTHKAMAGIELALWDIKAKALGVPVYELFGGPLHDRMRLYWSHCGTTRARMGHVLGTPPLRSYDDITALGKEVVARGFTALKTNMVIPGDPATVYFPGFASGINSTDGAPTVEILDAIERLIGTFREAVGPKVGLCLDLNYNFRTEGVLRVAKLLEQFDMQWVEYDNWDPQALLQIKQSTTTRLASLESLVSTRQYRPFLELHAVDVAIIDVPWNGFSQAVQIGRMAETYEINIAPHNYYSHLADLHSLHLCAVLPNVRIMEIDIDDVAWKADLVTKPPVIKDGHIFLPEGPGWGAEINEEVLRAHPWPGVGERARSFYGMSPEQMRARPSAT
ncbi:MAG TPA: mandelate racemase/muconate lactonizing enzyme family protein [Methylomirabilota bacterium]|jgi:L-alanine-DL-glutamate epimerase-like enolase superfamily enzyme|nr:mandelate racemase/muconate lactonizing enzyme family protein [Methylomirabilota bacterium]